MDNFNLAKVRTLAKLRIKVKKKGSEPPFHYYKATSSVFFFYQFMFCWLCLFEVQCLRIAYLAELHGLHLTDLVFNSTLSLNFALAFWKEIKAYCI